MPKLVSDYIRQNERASLLSSSGNLFQLVNAEDVKHQVDAILDSGGSINHFYTKRWLIKSTSLLENGGVFANGQNGFNFPPTYTPKINDVIECVFMNSDGINGVYEAIVSNDYVGSSQKNTFNHDGLILYNKGDNYHYLNRGASANWNWAQIDFESLGTQGPTGPQGAVGDQGYQGPTGPQGDTGLIGTIGIDGTGYSFIEYFGINSGQNVTITPDDIIGNILNITIDAPFSATGPQGPTGSISTIKVDTTTYSDVQSLAFLSGDNVFLSKQTDGQGLTITIGAQGNIEFTIGPSAPQKAKVGDKWFNTELGAELTYLPNYPDGVETPDPANYWVMVNSLAQGDTKELVIIGPEQQFSLGFEADSSTNELTFSGTKRVSININGSSREVIIDTKIANTLTAADDEIPSVKFVRDNFLSTTDTDYATMYVALNMTGNNINNGIMDAGEF